MDARHGSDSLRGYRLKKMLIVDDDEVTRKLLHEIFVKEGFETRLAESGESAVAVLRREAFPIVISDIRMLELDGLAVLTEAKRREPNCAVILMTGFGSMEGAVQAVQKGAFDYVSKPFQIQELKAVVARAWKLWDSPRGKSATPMHTELDVSARGLIGKSPRMVEVYKMLARAAMSSSTVLVRGESGTGKELVAHAIHDNSPRRQKKFVAVNCGALAENLLESELFGHVKGAFTGAVVDKRGLFEEASGGTLFLDEIGDLSPQLQVKLLRVLQECEVRPVGSNESRAVDVRVIAATHRDLDTLVKQGKFRDDLYYRLRVITIELPPLRERKEDLPELVGYFVSKYARKNGKHVSHFSDEAMQILSAHSWPGNIRELEHAIESAVALSTAPMLYPEDFPPEVLKKASSGGEVESEGSLESLEKTHILRVLQETQYNKSKASDILGIDRATLYRKAQRYGIDLRGK